MEALERISKQEMSPFETIDVDAFLTYTLYLFSLGMCGVSAGFSA